MTKSCCAAWLFVLLLPPAVARADEPREKGRAKETVVLGKVLLLFDVSPSMVAVTDEEPAEGGAAGKLPSRQDTVIGLLADEKATFLKRLQEKGPVFAYRFGRELDADFVVFAEGRAWTRAEWEKYQAGPEPRKVPEGKPWTRADWEAWLKPTLDTPERRRRFGGTDVAGSLCGLLKKEALGPLAGVVLLSDGRSSDGNEAAGREAAELVRRAEAPVFTVAAGRQRDRARVEGIEVRVPEEVRPRDKLRVSVTVRARGLAGKDESPVLLDLYKPSAREKPRTLKGAVKFANKGEAEGTVEFAIDPAADQAPLEEGEWRVVARVPRLRGDATPAAEYTSDPEYLVVNARPDPARRRVLFVLPRTCAAGRDLRVEAKVLGKDGEPLSAEAAPEITLRQPEGVKDKDAPARLTMKPLKDKPGWFGADLKPRAPGQYALTLKVAQTGDALTQRFTVTERDPELENVDPDLESLYSLAGPADQFTKHLDGEQRLALRKALREAAKSVTADKDADRLFLDLKGARLIPDCVVRQERRAVER
jgi:hypothetical protein